MSSPYNADRRLLLAFDLVAEAHRVLKETQDLVQQDCDHPVIIQNSMYSKYPTRICLRCRLMEDGTAESSTTKNWQSVNTDNPRLENDPDREVMQTESDSFMSLLDPTMMVTDLT